MNTLPEEVQGKIVSHIQHNNKKIRGLFSAKTLEYSRVEEQQVMDMLKPFQKRIVKALSALNNTLPRNTFTHWDTHHITPRGLLSKWPRHWEYERGAYATIWKVDDMENTLSERIVESVREAVGADNCVWTSSDAFSGTLTVSLGEVDGLHYSLRIMENSYMLDESLKEDRCLRFTMSYPDNTSCTVTVEVETEQYPDSFVMDVAFTESKKRKKDSVEWDERARQVVSWVKTVILSQKEPYLEMKLKCRNGEIQKAIKDSCGILYGLEYDE
jgi:hypothetical protein